MIPQQNAIGCARDALGPPPAGIFAHQRCSATVDHLPLLFTAGQLQVIGVGRRFVCFPLAH
jgi:hypothetical protein